MVDVKPEASQASSGVVQRPAPTWPALDLVDEARAGDAELFVARCFSRASLNANAHCHVQNTPSAMWATRGLVKHHVHSGAAAALALLLRLCPPLLTVVLELVEWCGDEERRALLLLLPLPFADDRGAEEDDVELAYDEDGETRGCDSDRERAVAVGTAYDGTFVVVVEALLAK